jgi:hypothetical protein
VSFQICIVAINKQRVQIACVVLDLCNSAGINVPSRVLYLETEAKCQWSRAIVPFRTPGDYDDSQGWRNTEGCSWNMSGRAPETADRTCDATTKNHA